MKPLSYIAGICILLGILSGCESESCPTVTYAYANFTVVNQAGKSTYFRDTVTVIGVTEATVNGTTQTVRDTIINKETSVKTLALPLSYAEQTTFIFQYSSKTPDTIRISHTNEPYFFNVDCGTMMFHSITTHALQRHFMDSLTLINPSVTNDAKENFRIYITAAD